MIIIILLFVSFYTSCNWYFDWSLCDSKPLQLSRAFLSILADLNSAEVGMVSILPLISSFPVYILGSEGLFHRLQQWLVLLSPPYSITFSALWQDPGIYLVFDFSTFSLICWNGKVIEKLFSFYQLKLNLVFWLRLGDLFVFQPPWEFSELHSPGYILVCLYTICLYCHFTACEIFTPVLVFPWILSDSKCPQISRTLLSILANFSNAVVSMIFILPLIFSSFSKPLGTIPNALNTNVITVILKLLSFFSSLTRSKYFSIFLLSFIFTLWSAGMKKSTWGLVLFFFFSLVWSICISKSQNFESFILLDGFWFIFIIIIAFLIIFIIHNLLFLLFFVVYSIIM